LSTLAKQDGDEIAPKGMTGVHKEALPINW
jgi:hypothetical protein